MPRIIVTSRYLKPNNNAPNTGVANLINYIATRETVENYTPQTMEIDFTKQLKTLLKRFPDSKNLFEYADYIADPSPHNQKELISEIIERNADKLYSREKLISYMAERPGVEKVSTHGLFSDTDSNIVLSKVMNEVANHAGNIWSHVVSLKREDAERLGYNTPEMWRQLVKRNITTIAEQSKIDLTNLQWYSAFHNTAHHPHIHLVVYSKNPKQGYLTNEGIEKIRSKLVNDIFQNELTEIYQKQTNERDLIKKTALQEMSALMDKLKNDTEVQPELQQLIIKLQTELQSVSGKKVYGYLPKNVKKTVDEITALLARNTVISEMYERWCELEKAKYASYTDAEKVIPPLMEQQAFKSIKNMIIKQVLDMDFITQAKNLYEFPNEEFDCSQAEPPPEMEYEAHDFEYPEPSNKPQYVEISSAPEEKKLYISWSKPYKKACDLLYKEKDFNGAFALLQSESDSGNILATHDIGKMYSGGLLGDENKNLADEYYKKALAGFIEVKYYSEKLIPYVEYRIGKMYYYGLGTEKNYETAYNCLSESAVGENQYAMFMLGRMYSQGRFVEKDDSQAFNWYKKSADKGNYYGCYETGQKLKNGVVAAVDLSESEQYFKDAYLKFKKAVALNPDDNLFYKLAYMSKNGIGCVENLTDAVDFYIKSADLGNPNAKYEYAKMLIEGNAVVEQDIDKALELFKSIGEKNQYAAYRLGKIYAMGNGIERNPEEAKKWFEISSDMGNEHAKWWLENYNFDGIYNQNMDANYAALLLLNVFAKLIEDDYTRNYHKHFAHTDHKLRRVIAQKKAAMGLKDEHAIQLE